MESVHTLLGFLVWAEPGTLCPFDLEDFDRRKREHMTSKPSGRGLSDLHLSALIIASMIGTGVFTTSGFSLAALGTREAVVLAWICGALYAGLGAVCYGWMAGLYPESGGEYVLLGLALHPSLGYTAGWLSILAGFTAPIAAAAHGLEAYLQRSGSLWIGALFILVSVALHGIKRDAGAVLQTSAVVLKLLLLVGFVLMGVGSISPSVSTTFVAETKWAQFGPTLMWISFSYSGWNAAIYLAGEQDGDASAWVRRGLIAVALVGVFYIILNTVFVYAGPMSLLSGRPDIGMAAAKAIGGSKLAWALSLVVALALGTSISSMMMAGPRVIAKMAEDGVFPKFLTKGGDTPYNAVMIQGVLALMVFFASTLSSLLGYIGLTLSLCTALTALALLWEWKKGRFRPKRPLYLLVPLVFVLTTFGMAGWMAWIKPQQAYASLATFAFGLVAWWLHKRFVKRPDVNG
ncbi:MAG TPA: amino acid permease [Myxococcales bacterium]|nr:amino acid permease [Myxococcales bacterium]